MLNSLSGRFLILTAVFVLIAEVFVLVPSVSRFRIDYLLGHLERAQIASLSLLADDMIDDELEGELLRNAGVFNVVLRRNEARQLVLSSPMPRPIDRSFDLREASFAKRVADAARRLVNPEPEIIRVIGSPLRGAGLLIEITMETSALRQAMIEFGVRVLLLSAVISVSTALLLFLAVRMFLVRPIKGVINHMAAYSDSPEDARRLIKPSAGVRELRDAEEALLSMQIELTQALKQKERLAQLGGAVARVSHDLRNILTSAQLFTDRIESSEDPAVQRLAPKLVNSITRAVNLCESTLAFGRAEEPAPRLSRVNLAALVSDVVASERLAVDDTQDLSFSEDVSAGLYLRADPEQLYRVIANLVRNARQAIVASGRPGEINITASETDSQWLIRVSDTGPGLPQKAREHLFKPFQGRASKGGTGLGLAIASELMRGHGGRLTLIASDKTGTVFEIGLPRGEL